MNLRKVELIVWHKTKKAEYQVLAIDWNTGGIDLIRAVETKDKPHASERLRYESIDSVVLAEIRFTN